MTCYILFTEKFCEDPLWYSKQDDITKGVVRAFMEKKANENHIAAEAAKNKARMSTR
jgi:hypothetical protein